MDLIAIIGPVVLLVLLGAAASAWGADSREPLTGHRS